MHDNFLHHASRAKLLVGTSPIAFEQIRADQQPALDAFAALPVETRTTSDLTRLLNWDKTSWSKTSNYTPLFDSAVASKLPILAADPPRDLIRATAKTGPSALPAEERSRLGLDTPLSDAQNAASLAEIEASHCGAIPKSAHPNMAYAQRYRDAHMADTLIKAAATNGSAVLITGNGHVRSDRGVPWYLRQRAPDKKVISVLLIEVEDGKTDPSDYVERDESGKPTADYIVFTPRAPRDKDPCEELRSKVPKN
ncbi:MAG: ChaN family lipoprotein [Hyphomicrobiaceae bacterium]